MKTRMPRFPVLNFLVGVPVLFCILLAWGLVEVSSRVARRILP